MDAAITRTLREALAAGPELRLAVLFGSQARGDARDDSDVDVAILPADKELGLAAELDLQARLESATGKTVDLVRLDHASTLLAWLIARDGRVVFDSGGEFTAFQVRAASEWFDFEPSYRAAEAAMLRRLAEAERRNVS
ncbi:MAG: nucleotidyltransferase domain-containing protein [Planctomycetes bacterium]|nr:nucleotidyltransferase domain-containing protein [Planctomycetota bacterium]